MKKRVAFLFPGQGAQTVGMGKDFYDGYSSAKMIFQEGDEILSKSLSNIVFNGPLDLLTETRHSQSGIYITSMAILNVLYDQFPSLKPTVCAGLSLGEYSALTAASFISFKECLPLVQFRSEVMNDACMSNKGAMAAIFGLSGDEIEKMVESLKMPQDLWVANFNSPEQTVISGTERGVAAGIEAAKSLGARRAVSLNVHGAFHSGLMRDAEEKLSDKIDKIKWQKNSAQIVMNASGQYESKLEKIGYFLKKQVTSSVRWYQTICTIVPDVDLFIEIGCGRVLSGLNKSIGVGIPTLVVNTVKDLEQLEQVVL